LGRVEKSYRGDVGSKGEGRKEKSFKVRPENFWLEDLVSEENG